MLLSREAEYAIQALLRLTNHDMNTFIPINVLAKELNIPFYYLSKILQKLVKHGFLNSHKGPRGGVAFAIDPEKMSVLDIVIAVDGDKIFGSCVMGLHKCEDENACPLHHQWQKLREDIRHMFSNESLAKLGRDPELMKRAKTIARASMN